MTEIQRSSEEVYNSFLKIVNTVREYKGLAGLPTIYSRMRLLEEIGFDSWDLAEMTVRIQSESISRPFFLQAFEKARNQATGRPR